jgi:selenoprotein W-related protein
MAEVFRRGTRDQRWHDERVPDEPKPRVTITYCTQCQWLLRAAWMAQELLQTFAGELGEVALVPGTGGVFRVAVSADTAGEVEVWDRKAAGGFPEITTLKQLVRDVVAPERSLGHSDRRAVSGRES